MKRWVTVGLLALLVAAHVSARESNILARLEGAIRVGPIANVVLSPNSRWTAQGVSRIVAVAQALPSRQTFPLANTNGLLARGLTMDTAEFLGRKAVRLVKRRGEGVDGFLPLPGVNFQDGTIEADVAVKITTQPGRPSPGFIGIAFRERPDASSYDMFYVRPGAAQADDQARRNQVAQYCAAPGYDWYRLRRAWPWVYEAHADLHLDVNATDVVHSGVSGNNGGYHTYPLALEVLPNESSS
jgi:hypothetical protein